MFKTVLVAGISCVSANQMFANPVEEGQNLNVNNDINRYDEDFQSMLDAHNFKDHGWGTCTTDYDDTSKHLVRVNSWGATCVHFPSAADAFRKCVYASKNKVGNNNLLAVDFEYQSCIKPNLYECFAVIAKPSFPSGASIVGNT